MMKIILPLLLIFSNVIFVQNKPSYPEPKKGYQRIDLLLPKVENQKELKVEVRFGLTTLIVDCAEGSFSFNKSDLKEYYGIAASWRYPYYVFENLNVDVSEGFQKDCVNRDIKVNKKILSSQNIWIEYQSSYPTPFYIPEGWTLEYRIWKASDKYISVENQN
jgi:ecotin